MSSVSVKIYESKIMGNAAYDYSVDNGNSFISGHYRILADHERHPRFNNMTIAEYNEKKEIDKDFANEEAFKLIPSKKIETVEEAYYAVASTIRTSFSDHCMKTKSSPSYEIKDSRKKYDDSITDSLRFFSGSKYRHNIEYSKADVNEGNISKLKENDYVALTNTKNFLLEFPTRRVTLKSDEIYVDTSHIPLFKKSKMTLKELKELDYEISEIHKHSKIARPEHDTRKYKVTELSLKPRPRIGSIASLLESRKAVKSLHDYYQARIDSGDPLFYQHMVDLYEESGKAVEHIEKILEIFDSLEEENEKINEFEDKNEQ